MTRTVANEQTAHPARPDDWPELISSVAFVHYEDGHYVAILDRFSVMGIGENPAEAWKQMDEHAKSYFALCEDEGLPFAQVVRPLATRDRIRLRAVAILDVLKHKIGGDGRPHEQRQRFVHPHPDDEHAHVLAC